MAPLMIHKSKLSKRIFLGVSLFCGLINQSTALGARIGILPWRPAKAPKVLTEPNEVIEKLTYSKSDTDYICDITLALEPNEATAFLKDYIGEYSKKNKPTDNTWGRAVFCLALVQTDEAKQYLLRLWSMYDQWLASGKIKIGLSDLGKSLPPLQVLGDAIHFYLWDDQVREWFICRIEEAEKLPKGTYPEFAKSSRRSNRVQLLGHLYRWDIIESVDDEPVVTSEKIMAFYPFLPHVVKNISKSAEKVVYWVKKLKPLHADMTEKQWLKIRKSYWEYKLDATTFLLGKPLAMTLWKQYLKEQNRNADIKDIKHRLWLISLWTYFHSLGRISNSSWVPDENDNSFLRDAITYVAQLPDGHIRKLAMESLFAITCYAPEELANQHIKKIRVLSKRLLTEDIRRRAILLAERNKRGKKRIEQNK